MERQLLDHPAAPGRRGLEQRARHAPVRLDGARPRASCRTASSTSRRSRCSRAASPQVAIGKDETYGMGLMVDTTYGMPVVHHGGDLIGYHSDMIWLPGAERRRGDPDQRRPRLDSPQPVPPQAARGAVRRPARGRRRRSPPPAKTFFEELAAERKLLTVPADAGAEREARGALRERGARRDRRQPRRARRRSSTSASGRARSRRARTPTAPSRSSRSRPASAGFEFVVGAGPKKTLVTRDAQHEYVFEAR